MSISVTCKCGRRFQAKREHAGRISRCTVCGEEIRIPLESQDPDTSAPPRMGGNGADVVESPRSVGPPRLPQQLGVRHVLTVPPRLVGMRWGLATYGVAIGLTLLSRIVAEHPESIVYCVIVVGLCVIGAVLAGKDHAAWWVFGVIVGLLHVGAVVLGIIRLTALRDYVPHLASYLLCLLMAVASVACVVFAIVFCWRATGLSRQCAVGDASTRTRARVIGVGLALIILVTASIPSYVSLWTARNAAREEAVSLNNLQLIGLAMLNYESAHRRFPLAARLSCDSAGQPGTALLSWRVLILPYLERGDLYEQFNLDEPWDSPHNLALLRYMPQIYACRPGQSEAPNHTCYQVFVTEDEQRHEGESVPQSPFRIDGRSCGLDIISSYDGSARTILVVEAQDCVPWTKPEDLPYTSGKTLPRLGGHFRRGFNAVFCDGHVEHIPAHLDESSVRRMISYNDAKWRGR